MSDTESVELPPEEEQPTPPVKTTKQKGSKRPATEERLEILRKAREKAAVVRKEKARVRQAEKQMKTDAFNARKKVADDYLAGKTAKLEEPKKTKKSERIFSREASEDEEEIEYVKKKKKPTKKPKKKVVYISESESEEEEQIIRVKKNKVKPAPTPPPTPSSYYDPITGNTYIL